MRKSSEALRVPRRAALLLGILLAAACARPAAAPRQPARTAASYFDRFHDKTVLVIVPHPDDDIIGCGGALAAMRGRGNRVVTVFLTSGDYGTDDTTLTPERLRVIRRGESARAYARLGYPDAKLIWLPYPSQDLDFADGHAVKADLVRIIREVRPDVVFALDPGAQFFRYHYHDHRTTAILSVDAITAAGMPLYLREAGRAHRVSETFLFYTAEPNLTIDVTPVLATKLAALREHRSQFPPFKQHYVADSTLPAVEEARRLVEGFTTDAAAEPFRHRGAPATPR